MYNLWATTTIPNCRRKAYRI